MPTNGFCVAFAPDGRSLAATGSGDVRAFLYDAMTEENQLVLKGPSTSSFTLAFAPDGRTLAAGDDRGALRIWDLATRSSQVSLLGHAGRIWCVAFAPDGRTLATTGGDGTIRLWDTQRRVDRAVFRGLAKIPMYPQNSTWASSVAFAADGTQLLASNGAGCVLACNLRDETSHTLRTANRPVQEGDARLAPDGSALATSERIEPVLSAKAEDWRYKTVIHDLSGRRGPITLPVVPVGESGLWSLDGRRLALVETTGNLALWDGVTGRLLGRVAAGFGTGSSGPTFLPTGDVVIAVCGDVLTGRPFDLVVWNTATSQLDRKPIPNEGPGPFTGILLAPDGRNLAGRARANVRLWDFPTLRRRFSLVGHSQTVLDLAFAPDGRTLATSSHDKTVRLWSVAGGQELLVLDGHTGPVRALAFSLDGRMLASCADGPDGGIEVIAWYTEGAARAGPRRDVLLHETGRRSAFMRSARTTR
jgi:WD40 repeat protein